MKLQLRLNDNKKDIQPGYRMDIPIILSEFYTRPLNQLLFLSSLGFFFITFAMLLSDTGLWYVPVKSADLIKTFITLPGPKFM